MKFFITGLISLGLYVSCALAQPGNAAWVKSFSFGRNHMVRSVHATKGGGFIIGGETSLADDNTDCVVLKVDASGKEEWHRTFGGAGYEMGCYVLPAADGGFIAAATTEDAMGSASRAHRQTDFLILKLDAKGSVQWQRRFDAGGEDNVTCVTEAAGGEFIIGGNTIVRPDSRFQQNSGISLVKLGATGDVKWNIVVPDSKDALLNDICYTKDGGFTLGATVVAEDKDYHLRAVCQVFHLGGDGKTLWTRTIKGTESQYLSRVQQTPDGGYILGGFKDGAMAANEVTDEAGFQLVRLNEDGTMEWQQVYPTPEGGSLTSVAQMEDGGYLAGGYTYRESPSEAEGRTGFTIMRISATGTVLWEKDIASESSFYQVIPSGDDYLLAGCNFQSNKAGDFNAITLAKLNASRPTNGNIMDSQLITLHPNPAGRLVTIECRGVTVRNIELVDDLGKVVFCSKEETANYKLDTKEFSNGIYILKLNTDNGIQYKKLVIQH